MTSDSMCESDTSEPLNDLVAALGDAFGTRFDLWLWRDSWLCVDVHGIPSQPANSGQITSAILAAVDATGVAETEPIVVGDSGNECLLVVPMQIAGEHTILATGLFRDVPADILRRTAKLCVQELRARVQLRELENELQSCQRQISHDFEQLVFMSELTENLAISEGTFDEWALARTGIPLLTHLVHAEAIALVEANRNEGRAEEKGANPTRPIFWSGPQTTSDDICRLLVNSYRNAAALQPLIKNSFDETREGLAFPGVQDMVLVSIVRRGTTLGWLIALNRMNPSRRGGGLRRGPGECRLSDLEFGTVEANLLSMAAERFATYAANVALLREKEQLLINMVRSLVSALDARDKYTRGHSDRVALIGRWLAKEIGLSDSESDRIYLTGLLHDIGKIGVSDAVLRKPGKLEPLEFDEIKRHPDLGYAILRSLAQLSYVLPGVRHHHENYDGTGYPDRLAAQDIPLSARILAVSDAYDAMASDRPYRPGMPHEKIQDILTRGAGNQWDPQIVAALVRRLPEILRLYQPDCDTNSNHTALPELSSLKNLPWEEVTAWVDEPNPASTQ